MLAYVHRNSANSYRCQNFVLFPLPCTSFTLQLCLTNRMVNTSSFSLTLQSTETRMMGELKGNWERKWKRWPVFQLCVQSFLIIKTDSLPQTTSSSSPYFLFVQKKLLIIKEKTQPAHLWNSFSTWCLNFGAYFNLVVNHTFLYNAAQTAMDCCWMH